LRYVTRQECGQDQVKGDHRPQQERRIVSTKFARWSKPTSCAPSRSVSGRWNRARARKITGLTPTAGGGFTALVGDIKQLTSALLTGTLGNVRVPVYIMNPIQKNAIGLVAAPGAGVFPFRDEVAAGNLGGWPIIESGTVPPGTVIVIDAR
jgi:hypothetical protein